MGCCFCALPPPAGSFKKLSQFVRQPRVVWTLGAQKWVLAYFIP